MSRWFRREDAIEAAGKERLHFFGIERTNKKGGNTVGTEYRRTLQKEKVFAIGKEGRISVGHSARGIRLSDLDRHAAAGRNAVDPGAGSRREQDIAVRIPIAAEISVHLADDLCLAA